jgi:hypothetical protein
MNLLFSIFYEWHKPTFFSAEDVVHIRESIEGEATLNLQFDLSFNRLLFASIDIDIDKMHVHDSVHRIFLSAMGIHQICFRGTLIHSRIAPNFHFFQFPKHETYPQTHQRS